MRIVFMGTPDFAVPCLQALVAAQYQIVGVFTQPDRAKGRSGKPTPTPVKEAALAAGIAVYQPERVCTPEVVAQVQVLAPDLIITAAYGQILPRAVLGLPRLGCINLHASLLPKLRGAAPIQWSIINGDTKTGNTIMYMEEGLDTGPVLLQEELEIGSEETAGQLFNRLAVMGAQLMLRALPLLEAGTLVPTPQQESLATYAPIITKALGELDFRKTATQIDCLVRGLQPWPVAYSYWQGQRVLFHKVKVVEGVGLPGEILDPKKLVVACGEQAVEVLEIQVPGKSKCSGTAFCNGRNPQKGNLFISPSHTPSSNFI